MPKPKGSPKTGGRKAGTPNKVTGEMKELIADIVGNNREQFEKDLRTLEPKDRIAVLEKLIGYVAPKTKKVNVEAKYKQGVNSRSQSV